MTQKTKKKGGKVLLLLVAIAIVIAVIVPNTKSHKYKKAQDLLWDGQYSGAMELLLELDDYKDSENLLLEARYGQAKRLMTYREYDEALYQLEILGDYKDASELITRCHYEQALDMISNEAYTEAIQALEDLGDYEDCPQLILKCHYQIANKAYYAKEYQKSYEEFLLAGEYENAAIRADEALYEYAHALFLEERYEEAGELFDAIEHQPEHAEPHFATLDDAAKFFAKKQAELADKIGCYVGELPKNCDSSNLWDYLSNYIYYEVSGNYYNEETKHLQVNPQYYPGDRILYAWRNDDTSILTKSEKEALTKAKSLVSKAKNSSKTAFGRELYLYNWLCNNVKYQSPNMEVSTEEYMKLRQLTCVGALIDGKANCQGYTDAFYLLGTMAGLDVYRFRGETDGEGHAWNGVMLDKKLYIVDVTFGDADNLGSTGKTYTWLNCSHDTKTYEFDGGTEAFPKLVKKNDLSKTYYTNKKSVFTTLTDASTYLLKQYKKNGKGWTFAVVKNKNYTNNDLTKSLSKNYQKVGLKSYNCTYVLEHYQGNTYIAIKWK